MTQLDRIEQKLDQVLAALKGRAAAPATAPATTGAVFPNYGKAKGQPVAGATERDLRFYGSRAVDSLADESKARWHDKERALLDAINAELARQHLDPIEEYEDDDSEPDDFGPPARTDDDIPF